MRLRLAPAAALLVIWVGCGGAFTSSDQGGSAGGSGGAGGSDSSGGAAGSSGTGMGPGGSGGSDGVGGSSAGGNGVGGSGVAGSSGTGGFAGRGGGSVDAGVDFTACDGPGQCMAVDSSCCGTCGTPELANFVGINTKHVQDYHQEKCPVALPCLACVQGKNPNIAARCDSGHCKVFDVRKVSEYSSCSTDAECHLRSGLGCCVCGGPDSAGWVSLNQSGELTIPKIMCAPMTACAACVPVPPANYTATCKGSVCAIETH